MNEVQYSEACGPDQLPEARTGNQGLDEITGGGSIFFFTIPVTPPGVDV